jgi:hypothetical protein
MTDTNAVIAVYDNHSAAENAVKELQKSGFDMKKLSVVGTWILHTLFAAPTARVPADTIVQ